MFYWDNAATTFPKPYAVRKAMAQALMQYGANPGRGGHAMAYATSEAVFRCRETAAELFGADSPENVIFTLNCTMAMNMVVKGILANGGNAVISDVEHNAVVRPLHALSMQKQVTYTAARVCFEDPAETVRQFEKAITAETRLIICSHASNVFGGIQPIRQIGAIAREHRIPFVVDAAQSAGVLPIDMARDNIDFLCIAGHKGLYGPMGTGMLITSGRYPLPSFIEGGTGSRSMDPRQPDDLPDHLESGTPNTAGICGLYAGMQFVKTVGIQHIHERELVHIGAVYRALQSMQGIQLYTPYPTETHFVPVLSYNVQGVPSEKTAALLNEAGVAVRAGLHCAPLAHLKMGTQDGGTVRLAPCVFTTDEETQRVIKILRQTAQKALQS